MTGENESVGRHVRLILQRSNGTRSVYHGVVIAASDFSITIRTNFGETISAPLAYSIIEWLENR